MRMLSPKENLYKNINRKESVKIRLFLKTEFERVISHRAILASSDCKLIKFYTRF